MRVTNRPGAFALVGPGRAGTAVALALAARGWRAVAVAGRTADAPSTQAIAARLGAPAVEVADAGRGDGDFADRRRRRRSLRRRPERPAADLVVIATPDSAIAGAAGELAPSLRPGALVVHLSGASTLHQLDAALVARPDVEVGSLHPLQSLPSGEAGADRLAGSWCAIDGSPGAERVARSLGMRPFRLDPADRAGYHAAACVASNHLVALLGQVERLAANAGVPFDAFLPLVRGTLDNVADLGPAAALTGPVARGDDETVARHLDALPADERTAYRALAHEARRLAGRDDGDARSDLEETLA
jgi:predicted short-subunit dehydrogenase-like oxidoreductase (DUF2520 family)